MGKTINNLLTSCLPTRCLNRFVLRKHKKSAFTTMGRSGADEVVFIESALRDCWTAHMPSTYPSHDTPRQLRWRPRAPLVQVLCFTPSGRHNLDASIGFAPHTRGPNAQSNNSLRHGALGWPNVRHRAQQAPDKDQAANRAPRAASSTRLARGCETFPHREFWLSLESRPRVHVA